MDSSHLTSIQKENELYNSENKLSLSDHDESNDSINRGFNIQFIIFHFFNSR